MLDVKSVGSKGLRDIIKVEDNDKSIIQRE